MTHAGMLIKLARINKGLSQHELECKAFGNNKNGQFVSNIERGKCTIPAKHLQAMAQALDIDAKLIVEAIIKDYRRYLMEVLNEPGKARKFDYPNKRTQKTQGLDKAVLSQLSIAGETVCLS